MKTPKEKPLKLTFSELNWLTNAVQSRAGLSQQLADKLEELHLRFIKEGT